MIITTNRNEFDDALSNTENTFLLIFGQEDKTAQKIHELASAPKAIEAWNIAVLIGGMAMLDAGEKAAWYKDSTHCTLLSKPDANGQRKVVEQIAFADLCTKGVVSTRKISAAFGRADAA